MPENDDLPGFYTKPVFEVFNNVRLDLGVGPWYNEAYHDGEPR